MLVENKEVDYVRSNLHSVINLPFHKRASRKQAHPGIKQAGPVITLSMCTVTTRYMYTVTYVSLLIYVSITKIQHILYVLTFSQHIPQEKSLLHPFPEKCFLASPLIKAPSRRDTALWLRLF